MKRKQRRRWLLWALGIPAAILLALFLLQAVWAHREGYFAPDYPRAALAGDSDYETIFLQTGLGRAAVDRLLAEGDFQAILDAQERFFDPPDADCTALLGWFTREDRLETSGTPLADLQPGDILLTLSTHSVGWRHGHVGLAIDGDTVLECVTLGTDSTLVSAAHWEDYGNYAVLRLKDAPSRLGQEIANYAAEHLRGVPYRLTAGFFGGKAPEPDTEGFGLQCAYLAWYVYARFGYDLDSDGGRLVSARDLLDSELLEVVQIYGMDPRSLLK